MKEISLKSSLLDYLDNVRDWLDRAEGDYRAGKKWQGELNLNLARAELKKAWEVSQEMSSQNKIVSIEANQAPEVVRKDKSVNRFHNFAKHRVGLVAALLIVFLFSFLPFFYQGLLKKEPEIANIDPEIVQRPLSSEISNQETFMLAYNQNEEVVELQTTSTRPKPINQHAYDQINLQFEIEKDIIAESKGVRVNTDDERFPKATINPQIMQLVSSDINLSGREMSNSIISQNSSLNPFAITKMNTINYDLDTLINEAKQALYTNR